MEPSDVFKHEPFLRYSEALTLADLDAIKHGYVYQYERTPWYNPINKFKYLVAIGTMNSLFQRLEDGKPIKKRGKDENK